MNDGKHAKGLAPHLRRLARDVAYTKGHAQVMLAAADELDRLTRDNGIMLDAEYRASDLQRQRAERAEAQRDALNRTVTRREMEIAEQREDIARWKTAYESLANTKKSRKRT